MVFQNKWSAFINVLSGFWIEETALGTLPGHGHQEFQLKDPSWQYWEFLLRMLLSPVETVTFL